MKPQSLPSTPTATSPLNKYLLQTTIGIIQQLGNSSCHCEDQSWVRQWKLIFYTTQCLSLFQLMLHEWSGKKPLNLYLTIMRQYTSKKLDPGKLHLILGTTTRLQLTTTMSKSAQMFRHNLRPWSGMHRIAWTSTQRSGSFPGSRSRTMRRTSGILLSTIPGCSPCNSTRKNALSSCKHRIIIHAHHPPSRISSEFFRDE